MKKKILAFVMAAMFATLSSNVWALPHDNRSDVDTWVKIFVPYEAVSVGVERPAGTVTITDAAKTAGTPSGTNATTTTTVLYTATTAGMVSLLMTTSGVFYAEFADGLDHDITFPAPVFTGVAMSTHTHGDTATFLGSGSTLQGLGTGSPLTAEVNSLGFGAVQMTQASDDAHMIVPLPDNICVDCPIKISVAWSTSDTTPTTDTATWKVLYSAIAAGESLTAASTALNTVITADAIDGDSYALQETPQGQINAKTLSRGDTLHILAELDAVSGLNPAVDTVFFHGIYIEYVREQL